MAIREDYTQLKEKFSDFFADYEAFYGHVCEGEESLKENYGRRCIAFTTRNEQIEKQSFSVVVIGEIKHGKSTLLNALLQKPAFPKDIQEATATVSYLRHNDTAPNPEWHNKAVVTFYDETKAPAVTEHTELAEYTTRMSKTLKVAEEVKEVSIYTDSRFVEDGVTVVDTPGTNTPVAKHEKITNEQIAKSNAAIFLFKATEAGKKTDFEFLANAASTIDKFFFVLNRIDELGSDEREIKEKADRIIGDIQKKIREIPDLEGLDKLKFYRTSGLLALLARFGYVENEKYSKGIWDKLDEKSFRDELLKQSGIPDFEKDLEQYLFGGQRIKDFFQSHIKYLEACLKEDQELLNERRDALEGKTDIRELEQRKAELELEKERQQAKIEASAATLNEKLESALDEFLKEVPINIENIINKFKDELGEYSTLDSLESVWEDYLSHRPSVLYANLRNSLSNILKDTVKNVFKGQDSKLRGQLNSSLQTAGIATLPEISDAFSPLKTVAVAVPTDLSDKLVELKRQLEGLNQQLQNSSEAETNFEILKTNRESLEREIERTAATAERRTAMLGNRPPVQTITIQPYDTEEDREGLGYYFQWAIGRRTVHHPARIEKDSSAQKQYDEDCKKIQEWEERKRKELEDKCTALQDKYTAAQIDMEKQRNLKKLTEQVEKQYQIAQMELNDALQAAKTNALKQNKLQLVRSLEEACQRLAEDLKQSTSKCAEWAETYISGIQVEVDNFMKTKGAELENLMKLINEKQEEKQQALERLDVLMQEFDNLNCQFDFLKQEEEEYAK